MIRTYIAGATIIALLSWYGYTKYTIEKLEHTIDKQKVENFKDKNKAKNEKFEAVQKERLEHTINEINKTKKDTDEEIDTSSGSHSISL